MVSLKVCVIFTLAVVTCASPATKAAFWKGTSFDADVEQMRSLCAEDDPIACLKYKAISFLDRMLQQDNYDISENVKVSRNTYRSNEVSSRSDSSIETNIEEYVKSHDVTFKLPIVGSVTLGARNLDNDELDFKLDFSSGNEVQARKSKLKKIFIPILVFVLLKAMTLVPLALGILGLKAWNALQLSFFSFVISVGLAIFQLCKKIAADGAAPQIAAHGPWEAAPYANHYAARSFDSSADAQPLAYSAYAPQ